MDKENKDKSMTTTRIDQTESGISTPEVDLKSDQSKPQKKSKKKIIIIVSIIAAVVIAAAVVVIILVWPGGDNKKDKKVNTNPNPNSDSTDDTQTPDNSDKPLPTDNPDPTSHIDPKPSDTTGPNSKPSTENDTTNQSSEPSSTTPGLNPGPTDPLKSEFTIATNQGDFKSISVVQKSYDQSKLNDKVISSDVTRETNYHIYILSEEDASPENQNYYQKMYTGAMTIVSECYHAENEACEMKEMVDLTKLSDDKSKTRILDDNTDFKNIPLATCLFNITNNDFITSITCHKDFPDIKKNEMLLDLYFFRSPAIERKNKTRDNITLTITTDEKNNTHIHELNGGLCNIRNNWGSLCTTDMNITTDKDGNLLSYDEVAVTNIVYDEKNSFTKNKISHLVDHSEKITKEDADKYKNSLEKLLAKMKPYMKEDVQFPQEKFTELYNLVKHDKGDSETEKETSSRRRRLTSADAIQYVRQKEIFHIDSLGVEVNLNLKLNPGLNTDAMRGHLNFSFDEEEHNIYKKDQISNIQYIIDQLRALSRAGNKLAAELYDKISDNLENFPKDLKLKLSSLYDLVQYYDLYAVFNHTLKTVSFNKLPSLVIKLSEELENKMNLLYTNIEKKGEVKNYVEELTKILYDFVDDSHELVDAIYNNLKELNRN